MSNYLKCSALPCLALALGTEKQPGHVNVRFITFFRRKAVKISSKKTLVAFFIHHQFNYLHQEREIIALEGENGLIWGYFIQIFHYQLQSRRNWLDRSLAFRQFRSKSPFSLKFQLSVSYTDFDLFALMEVSISSNSTLELKRKKSI